MESRYLGNDGEDCYFEFVGGFVFGFPKKDCIIKMGGK